MKKSVIFATGNPDKVKEIREILGTKEYDVLSLKDINLEIEIDENGSTFEENAIIKAKTIMQLTGKITLADDSGFEVDYLDKKPGVLSARFLGEDTSYQVKNAELIRLCQDAKEEERSARFVCVIACAFPSGEVITTRGEIEGMLAHKPSGSHGFGYDPIFYLPEKGCTTADLSSEEKNQISHRGIALRKMLERLTELDGDRS